MGHYQRSGNATVQMLKEHYDSPTHAQAAEWRKEEVLNAL